MREPSLDYFYGDTVKIDSFCRIPRILVTDEFYRTIPAEIKVLYSLMLDRVAMSMRNGWRDKGGRVFIYFTIRDAARLLNVGKDKALQLFDRMETLGLIRRRKQAPKQPTRIFVRTFTDVPDTEEAFPENATDFTEADSAPSATLETSAQIDQRPVRGESATPAQDIASGTPAQIDAPDTRVDSDSKEPDAVRRGLSDLLRACAVGVRRLGDLLIGSDAPGTRTSRNQTSRLPSPGSPDFPKSERNYTNEKYEEFFDYNQSINRKDAALYEGENPEQARAARKEKNLESMRGLIQDDVDYAGLMRDYPNRREEIEGYVEIMAQRCCSDLREIRINRRNFPQACVRSRFEKLERRHMEYVLKRLAHIPPNIRNVRAYALSTLYNSYAILQRGPISEKRRKRRGSVTKTGITRTNDARKG